MKISLVSVQLGMGGAENLVCNLADQFISMGHEVQLISLLGEPVILPKSPFVKIHNLRISKGNPFSWLSGIWYYFIAIKSFKPDVVHAHSFHSIIFSRIARIFLKYPVLVSTGHHDKEGEGIEGLLYVATDHLGDLMTNISQSSTESLRDRLKIKNIKLITVYNGIDTEYYRFSLEDRTMIRDTMNISNHQKLILAVGRISPEKDYPNLVRAMSLVVQNFPENSVMLCIVGTGPKDYVDELKKLIIEKNLESSIKFMGIQREIPAYMSACDLFVLPSASEGFGLVVAEAMACERVVVATDSGGVKEVMGGIGFICPIQNHVALSNAIIRALRLSQSDKIQTGHIARKRIVEKFSLKNIAQKWVCIYNSIHLKASDQNSKFETTESIESSYISREEE